ncbi:MAG: hypothetical protein HYV26_06160 [Candidatus Hydrogenedentes bacterium]|nr:hypothetical protein [Candidatus Hydrogenedentota bacterium]MBI3118778.1 hypothetical protein [Candidatus Hydrogenedentota bacterium]
MDMVVCPHCKNHRLVTSRVPKDVIVVMPCPSCHELAVVFRNRVIPLNRRVLERGTFDERKNHLAEVIAHFLEAGIFPFGFGEDGAEMPFGMDTRPGAADQEDQTDPISEEEMDRFTRIELKRLDNPAYFKRHFG